MHILFWIIVGIIAGALARMVVPGATGGGILTDLIVGIIGALVGGWIMQAFGSTGSAAANGYIWSTLVAFLGSVVLLFIYRAVTRGTTGGRTL